VEILASGIFPIAQVELWHWHAGLAST
jgi:hypothetical protein